MQHVCSTSPDLVFAGFHVLADPLRTHVVELLRHRELSVGALCVSLDINQSKLSLHLKFLNDAELVHTRHEGRWIYYSLNLAQFVVL